MASGCCVEQTLSMVSGSAWKQHQLLVIVLDNLVVLIGNSCISSLIGLLFSEIYRIVSQKQITDGGGEVGKPRNTEL